MLCLRFALADDFISGQSSVFSLIKARLYLKKTGDVKCQNRKAVLDAMRHQKMNLIPTGDMCNCFERMSKGAGRVKVQHLSAWCVKSVWQLKCYYHHKFTRCREEI